MFSQFFGSTFDDVGLLS